MSHTPPVDSKGAAIRKKLEKLEVPNLIIMLEEGQQITTGHLVEKTIDEILAILAQEVNEARIDELELFEVAMEESARPNIDWYREPFQCVHDQVSDRLKQLERLG